MGMMRSLAFSRAVISSGKTYMTGPGLRSMHQPTKLCPHSDPPVCGLLQMMTVSTPGVPAASMMPVR